MPCPFGHEHHVVKLYKSGSGAAIAVVIALLAMAAAAAAFISRDWQVSKSAVALRRQCGVHARMVWCRQVAGDNRDVGCAGSGLLLMGLDSDERNGERAILRKAGNYHKPLLTPRGDRVVFSDLTAGKIRVVNWNGAALMDLADGRAAGLWRDPADGSEWVYALPPLREPDEDEGLPLFRFRLDNPAVLEKVWDKTPMVSDNIQLSRDGRCMGGLFPWPRAGLANLAAGTFEEKGRGCWASLAPDDSRLLWVFDGAHRNLVFHPADGRRKWALCLSDAPGVDGWEAYHPRWSNQIRFFCMTGPYKGGVGANRIRAGGADVEVYAGRFAADLRSVEVWLRVTDNQSPDFFPDLWLDPAGGVAGARLFSDAGPPGASSRDQIVARARLLEATAIPAPASIAPYRHALVVYVYSVEKIVAGVYPHKRLLVAHWGILDGAVRDPGRRPGESYTLRLEPYAAHPELEGERLIMGVPDPGLPLLYDTGGR